jgi:hypothetical protein
MGLIKTAMMSGVGLYAINKISKEASHRRNDSNAQPQQRNYYTTDPQYYQRQDNNNNNFPQPMNFRDYPSGNNRQQQPQISNYPDQEPVYLNNGIPSSQYYDNRAPASQQAPPPPPQYYRGAIQQGFVEPEPVDEPTRRGGSTNEMFTMLEQFVNPADSQGNGRKGGKQGLLGSLLQK